MSKERATTTTNEQDKWARLGEAREQGRVQGDDMRKNEDDKWASLGDARDQGRVQGDDEERGK